MFEEVVTLMETPTITGVIIAKNESAMILNCLDTLRWCSEILVIDDGSTDDTASLAENAGARVVSFKSNSFKRLREEALKHIKTDWLVYIDADERVLPTLAKEILVSIETNVAPACSIRRKNIHFGVEMTHGGWEEDWVTRVFKTDQLNGWVGDVHESPDITGDPKKLKTRLLHLSHRDVISGLKKTSDWTPIEAKALFESNVEPVTFFTICRKGFMEFIRRVFLKSGRKDGMAGLIEATVQGINKALIYMQVWELQQQPTIPDTYKKYEEAVTKAWKES
ncbi:MAG: glycosyltransferase family 2 protein [Microgenomates group bacterium]